MSGAAPPPPLIEGGWVNRRKMGEGWRGDGVP